MKRRCREIEARKFDSFSVPVARLMDRVASANVSPTADTPDLITTIDFELKL